MNITFIEIQNFRKLKSVRIDLSKQTTLLVGANNSGKTSATLALRYFLVEPKMFSTNDFTLSNWALIESIAAGWETQAATQNAAAPSLDAWEPALPSLDVWLEIGASEIHYVRRLLPTLDWAGGALGVRLRFEPKAVLELYKDYLTELKTAKDTKLAGSASAPNRNYKLTLWPENMRNYLDRRLQAQFGVRAYLLDPAACVSPTNGIAKPQLLPKGIGPIEGNPLSGLIRVNAIAAQRGLGEQSSEQPDADGQAVAAERKPLSQQLRAYYARHLDPYTLPDAADLDALEAIEKSEQVFDRRLETGFSSAIKELQGLNYPGVADPKLTIATRLRLTDGLNHSAAVQYELSTPAEASLPSPLRLPEEYNGLGYQNLISIVFRLMAFRDAWMRVGKAEKVSALRQDKQVSLAPLHLVLVEEPEAHLHPQVQQVFVRKAYDILRNNNDLKDNPALQTQLIVSTHSSHIAHECPFSYLRYFRRLAPAAGCVVPTAAVINLSEVFGSNDDTEKFVTRYIRATHCDLFFADGAILVEGVAERILVPHFIREHFKVLNRCYVTLMEVGGSHAHRLRKLIEHLGLTTLIITDVDAGEAQGHHKSTPPKRGCGQVTNNATLKEWHPKKTLYDELVNLADKDKVKTYDFPQFSVRVAYQGSVMVKLNPADVATEALPSTFEDSLAFENLDLFKSIDGGKLVGNLKEIVTTKTNVAELIIETSEVVREGGKAEFALDLLTMKEDLNTVKIPKYIEDGLKWMELQLDQNRQQLLKPAAVPAPAAPAASAALPS
jgi:predicted ATP-dependent endonuclease of OLD family